MFVRSPVRLLDLAPFPTGAVTVTVESLGDVDPSWPVYYSNTDPRLTFWNFSWLYDPLQTGSRNPLLSPNHWAGDWARVTIDGGVRASAVRVTGYTATELAMVCHTKSDSTVTARITGPGTARAKGVFDIQAPDITYCHFVGFGEIESFSFVPQRTQPQEALKLTCDNTTPERGELITCTAAAEPAGAALEVTGWTFEGEGSVVHPEPGDERQTEWAGRMVVSGTITVAGTVNGKEAAPAKAEITVRPRQAFAIRYPALPNVEWVGGEGAELPYPPTNMAPGTEAHGILGKFLEVSPSFALDEGSGPNAGWVYVPAPPEFTGLRLFMNRALLPDDPFYRLQQGDERRVDIRNARPMCGPRFMAQARVETEAHERGHYDVAARFWAGTAVSTAYEGWHLFDPEGRVDASYAKRALTDPFWNQLGELQRQWDRTDRLVVPCEFAQPSS